MAGTGWLKLNRGITDNWLWPKGRKYTELEAWMWMLINANFADSKVFDDGKLITVKRGQLLTSQLSMSKTFLWSREKVRNFSEILKTDGMIDVKPYTKFTIITICKYEDYQSDRTAEQQQTGQQTDRRPDNRPDTSEEGKEGEERKEGEYQGEKVSLERCIQIAMLDPKWMDSVKPTKQQFDDFTKHLIGNSEYEKLPIDFKSHFFNWRNKQKPDEKKLTIGNLKA